MRTTAVQDKRDFRVKKLLSKAKASNKIDNKMLVMLALKEFDISLPTARRYAKIARRKMNDG